MTEINMNYNSCVFYSKFNNKMTGNTTKTCRPAGNLTQTKTRVRFIKYSVSKLVTLLCTALLTQALLPSGWKTTDNFKTEK